MFAQPIRAGSLHREVGPQWGLHGVPEAELWSCWGPGVNLGRAAARVETLSDGHGAAHLGLGAGGGAHVGAGPPGLERGGGGAGGGHCVRREEERRGGAALGGGRREAKVFPQTRRCDGSPTWEYTTQTTRTG